MNCATWLRIYSHLPPVQRAFQNPKNRRPLWRAAPGFTATRCGFLMKPPLAKPNAWVVFAVLWGMHSQHRLFAKCVDTETRSRPIPNVEDSVSSFRVLHNLRTQPNSKHSDAMPVMLLIYLIRRAQQPDSSGRARPEISCYTLFVCLFRFNGYMPIRAISKIKSIQLGQDGTRVECSEA